MNEEYKHKYLKYKKKYLNYKKKQKGGAVTVGEQGRVVGREWLDISDFRKDIGKFIKDNADDIESVINKYDFK